MSHQVPSKGAFHRGRAENTHQWWVAVTPSAFRETSIQNIRWHKAGSWFEFNNAYPSIKGDPGDVQSLKSFGRRFLASKVSLSFTDASRDVSVKDRVFKTIAELTTKVASPKVKHAYHKCCLLPFIQKHSAKQCRQALRRPSRELIGHTIEIARQMAHGGVK